MKIYVQKGQNVQQNNTKKYVFLSLAAIFLISAILWFKFAGGSAVHDLRNTAQSTRQELTDARTAQQREASDLTEAGRAVERSEQAVTDSKDSNRELQERERTDSEIIRESQSIIDQVRERGPAQDTGED